MAKNEKIKEINLLPQEEIENSTFGRTLRWLLTSFRYIVIATEMIVMGAFLARFWLDARSSALIDSINQKKAIISSYSVFEKEFRSTQDKLAIYKNFASSGKKVSPVTENIKNSVPTDVTLTQISIADTTVTISGLTSSENSISGFMNKLNSGTTISNTKVKSISSKEDGSLSFVLSGTIKEREANGSSS